MSKAYSVVRDVLTVVRRTELGRSLAAHVVQCHSEKDVKKFNVFINRQFYYTKCYDTKSFSWRGCLAVLSITTPPSSGVR